MNNLILITVDSTHFVFSTSFQNKQCFAILKMGGLFWSMNQSLNLSQVCNEYYVTVPLTAIEFINCLNLHALDLCQSNSQT